MFDTLIAADPKLQRLSASQVKRLPVGQRVRWLRQRKGYSHDVLAERAGTTRSHLIKIEKGIHRPTAEMRARLTVALETTPDFLSDGSEDDEEEADLARQLMTVLRQIAAHEAAKGVA